MRQDGRLHSLCTIGSSALPGLCMALPTELLCCCAAAHSRQRAVSAASAAQSRNRSMYPLCRVKIRMAVLRGSGTGWREQAAVRLGAGACAGQRRGSAGQRAASRMLSPGGAEDRRMAQQAGWATRHSMPAPRGRQQRKGRGSSATARQQRKGTHRNKGCPPSSHDVEEAQHHRGHKVHLRNII